MTSPERIWVDETAIQTDDEGSHITCDPEGSFVEYVRADLHREESLQYLSDTGQMMDRIADLTAANAALAAECARLTEMADDQRAADYRAWQEAEYRAWKAEAGK